MSSNYSPTWFDTFLLSVTPGSTGDELGFLERQIPLPGYRSVLDLCCGTGRHSLALSEMGYDVTGVDANAYALQAARGHDSASKVRFIEADMRDLSAVEGQFDAVLNLWQSFGYFSPQENAAVLRQIYGKLRQGGRFVLDIYNRHFFEAHQGTRKLDAGGRHIIETKQMTGDRLTVRLDYGPTTPPDIFEWQLYTPDDIKLLAKEEGLQTIVACSGFDEQSPPTPDNPRMQFTFEKS